MWDSPYQASRFCTASTWFAAASGATFDAADAAVCTSGMTGSEIGFLDALVLREVGVIALREHLAAGQHGDDVGEVGDHVQIMLDHQDGVLCGDALDQRGDLVDVFMAHAGH